jgi:hypothetical protein
MPTATLGAEYRRKIVASFCKQCSFEIFEEDHGDMAGLLNDEQAALGFVCTVICEGCGITQVNNDGECVSPHCIHKHGSKDAPASQAHPQADR